MFKDIKEQMSYFESLERRISRFENTLLNISFNSNLHLKIMKIEQDNIKIKQRLLQLELAQEEGD